MDEYTKTLLTPLTKNHFMLTHKKKPLQNLKWLFKFYSSFSIKYLFMHSQFHKKVDFTVNPSVNDAITKSSLVLQFKKANVIMSRNAEV